MSTGRPRLTGDARAKLVQKTAGLVEEAGSSGGALGADPAGPCAGRVRSARVVEGDVPYANARAESLKEAAPVAVAPKRRNGGKKKKKRAGERMTSGKRLSPLRGKFVPLAARVACWLPPTAEIRLESVRKRGRSRRRCLDAIDPAHAEG